jgi:hypothetical protein
MQSKIMSSAIQNNMRFSLYINWTLVASLSDSRRCNQSLSFRSSNPGGHLHSITALASGAGPAQFLSPLSPSFNNFENLFFISFVLQNYTL